MKQNWTMYVYKADRRKKSGERVVSTTVWTDRTRETMDNEVRGLRAQLYPTLAGYRIEVVPTTKMVKNLMSGEMVEIPYDTPRSCDPSSELYWSM
jgi:hypothetical protein